MARQPSHSEAEGAIGDLVLTLQQNLQSYTGLTVTEIVKAGSMGHGTTVPGHFDIDLVLYSSDVKKEVVNRDGYSSYLDKLERFVGRVFGRDTISEIGTTRFAVQFKYRGYIDVDILVSPVWWDHAQTPEKLFHFLQFNVRNDPEARHKFSVNASKWQVSFMKKQPSKVKECITRAKAWRNRLWPKSEGGKGRPSSYLISLLVLRAYENRSGPNAARSTTEELKKLVRNHSRMNIYWEDYYTAAQYRRLFPSSLPRLVDPANPANNVYLSGIGPYPRNKRASDYDVGDGDWSQFVTKVEYFDLERSVEEITS